MSATALTPRPAGEPHEVFAATRALCNRCHALTDAQVVFAGNRVYLDKWCLAHGRTRSLISSSREWYLRSLAFVKPGTDPKERAVTSSAPCPTACGLCPRHAQHTCVPILEITAECDLSCPVCLVDEKVQPALTVDQVKHLTDRLVAYEGRLNMLNLSGGEPTLHPGLLQVVDAVRRPEVGIVSLSTHGLKLLTDDALLEGLVERGVVIALQFDGFRPGTYQKLRGSGKLAAQKQRIVERVLKAGGKLSLTVTVARGVNEDELPDILSLLFREDAIVSAMFQPLSHAGRLAPGVSGDVLDVVTIPEMVSRLAAGSGGMLGERHFSPLPCSHPSCFALTYLLKLEDGRLLPLPDLVRPEDYLDIIKNQALLGTDLDSLEKVKDSLYTVWSADGVMAHREAVLKAVRQVLLDVNALSRNAPVAEVLSVGVRHVKSIFIHHFMDAATFDLSRVAKCCNHYPLADGRLIPACVRNNVWPPPEGVA